MRDEKGDDVYNKGGGEFGVLLMVYDIEYALSSELSPERLSELTSSFNPNRVSVFDQTDWSMFQAQPSDLSYQEADRFWRGIDNPMPYQQDGVYVTMWRAPWEGAPVLSVFWTVFHPSDPRKVILYYGP